MTAGAQAAEQMNREILARTPHGRWGVPEDLGGLRRSSSRRRRPTS